MTPRQLLAKARVETFGHLPYLSSWVYSLREQETPGIGTAAVDAAGNLYWDPEFITRIGRDQTAYLLLHEVLHLIFDHHSRAQEIIGENPSDLQRFVCNVAGDLVIEQTLDMMRHLRPEGAVHLGVEVPAWGITLDFPENKSMQEYYRLIMEKLKKSGDNNQQQGDSDGESDSDGSAGSGGEQGDSSASGGDDPDEGGQGDDDMGGEGSDGGAGSPGAGGDADEDGADANGSKSPSGSGAGSPPSGQGSASPPPGSPGTGGSCADGCPRPYEIESDGSWEAYGEDMAAAQAEEAIAKYESSNPGKVPGSIKQALKQKLRPTPDPFDQLRSAVCTSVASPVGGRDYSHRRRSRKQPPGDDAPLLHGRITVQPHAVVIVDTSASMMMTKVQAKALSVIAQGLRKLGRVKVYCADTQVQSHKMVATTKLFEWHGGGGTDMSTAIEQVEQADKPDSIVLITDAATDWHGKKPRARVVVAYTGHNGSHWHNSIPKWARVVPLTQEA
jgi:predicted metal-dependent peptidase